MAGIRLSWWVRLGLVGCAVSLLVVNWAVRRAPTGTVSSDRLAAAADDPDHAGEPRLVNEGWRLRSMATANGAFVIEVEVDAEDPIPIETIARALVEPIRDRHDEILVSVSTLGDESALPTRRMRWTPGGGYVEITDDQPERDR